MPNPTVKPTPANQAAASAAPRQPADVPRQAIKPKPASEPSEPTSQGVNHATK